MMDVSKMQRLLEEFSNYLRMSIDFHSLKHEVLLEQEFSLVRSYLYIEKERFGDRLNVKWELAKDIALQLPPLSIQTLVENAARRGILQRQEGRLICIRIHDYENYMEISILDNGVGMDAEKLEQIFEQSGVSKEKGIGLKNTHRRLKQMYGKGLQIRSECNQGTEVSFQIPKKE